VDDCEILLPSSSAIVAAIVNRSSSCPLPHLRRNSLNMILVFFIYGLSFFLLGTVVLIQARRDSGFWVERHLWLLAGFGLLHGLNEWLDMFLLLGSAQWGEGGIKAIEVFRFFVGQVSYVFLLQFGVALVLHGRNRCRWCPRATLAVCTVFILGFAIRGWLCHFNKQWFLTSDITMRYLVAFPGAALTGAGFFMERHNPEIKRLDAPAVRRGLAGLGVSFCLYAILAGLVVKPAPFFPASAVNYATFMQVTRLPVQVFRAGCAITALFFVGRALRVFELRTRRELNNAYRELIRTSNREQARIGQDLHDGLGQQLAGIAYMSKIMEKRVREHLPEEAPTAKQIREDLEDAMDMTRSLARGLHPAAIERDGLGFALRELAENTERVFGVACAASVGEAVRIEDTATAGHLFRIAQEAVANAVKHAKTDSIRVDLRSDALGISLSVTDNGAGMPKEIDTTRGLGLRIMRYRAEVIGATLDIARAPGGGTVVRAVLSE